MTTKKGGLGRGLDALFTENATDQNASVPLPLRDVEPNRQQPRRDFDEAALEELAESIRLHGVLQPILVRPLPGGTYQIVAGERRWRASRLAGLTEIPAIIREMDEQTASELAMIENLQREDLNAIEEAEGYRRLMETFSLTQEQVAQRVGKSRSAVANALRLLDLDEPTREAVRAGAFSAGHARALLSVSDPSLRRQLAERARQGASVRELERAARNDRPAQSRPRRTKSGEAQPTFFREVELAMREELHRQVRITPTGAESGTLLIEFFNKDELADLAARIAGENW